MCASYNCLKNALLFLNILYGVVGASLLYGTWTGKFEAPYLEDVPVLLGAEFFGLYLVLIASIGLLGTTKHNQIVLFFYMILLFIMFLLQVILTVAIVKSWSQEDKGQATRIWSKMSEESKLGFQRDFECCSFEYGLKSSCYRNPCCTDKYSMNCECPNCVEKMQKYTDNVIKWFGLCGIFFSFTEILGVWLTRRYRNQKDPKAHPSAFL